MLAAPDDPAPRSLATDSTMSSSAGVSELMDAEKKASTVVAEARAARSDRLKAAKAEAGAAVDDLRKARESEHALTTSSDSDAKEAQAISAKADGDGARPPSHGESTTKLHNHNYYSRAPSSPTTSAPSCKGGPVLSSSNGSRRTSARNVSPRRTP